jgi:putative phosphoribosyl transferase
MAMKRFRDRIDAGRQLAAKLGSYAAEQPLVLALPRGGIHVGYEVARALDAPLDVWIVRKLGVPWQPELGVGAISEGNHVHITRDIQQRVGLSDEELERVIEEQRVEVARRVRRYRASRPRPELRDRTIILVDDGIATGGTVRAAIRAIRAESPKKIVLAVPVVAAPAVGELAGEADEMVTLLRPSDLYAIGLWYDDFQQLSDEEVVRVLDLAQAEYTRHTHAV